MRRIIVIILLTGAVLMAKAQVQRDPAHWAYGLKKLTGSTYEVHLQCAIDDGWHIYAQKQTKDFIGTRTKITLDKIPGMTLIGTPAELGKKDTYTVKGVGIRNYEYVGKVDFVQKVSLRPGVKSIAGTITYQTCTHEKCLPETTISFTVPVPQ
jgi:DsbC/DsbD-like thiol-disulfide interchange protein